MPSRVWLWLRRALVALVALAALVVAALLVWWSLAGRDFLYRAIFPDHARLLAGQTVPDELGEGELGTDLAFLEDELPRLHVAFAEAFGERELRNRIAEVRAAAGSHTSTRRQLELVGLLAAGGPGTGHTMIIPLQRSLDWRIYPLSTYLFDDGLYVTAAAERYRRAVGAQVTAIGGEPTEVALERLARYVPSDNQWSLAANLPPLLGMAEPLIALGLATVEGTLTLGLAGQTEPLAVAPVALTSWAGLSWARQTQVPVEGLWSPADARRRARPYTLTRGPDSGTLLLRLNEMRSASDESFSQLAERLDRMAKEEPVERFLIDLRANGGGNNLLPRPLLDLVADHPVLDRRGVLFVLIGRRSFSAAGNFAGGLERRTRAVFVGEPSGFRPSHFGDARPILLPGSKMVARIASRRWQEDLPGVDRPALLPDLPVPFLARHHFEDLDPTLAAIHAYQEEPPVESSASSLAEAVKVKSQHLGSYLLSPHHRVRLFEQDERPRLAIDAVGPFAMTDLHGEGSRKTTDIRGVELELRPQEAPVLHWHGAAFALEPVESGHRLPFERIEAGEIEAGVAAYRAAAKATVLGSDHELALNRIAYRLLEEDRAAEAVQLFELLTELFPHSANTFDSLGDGLSAVGDLRGAIAAYRRGLELDPLFDHSRQRLSELESR